MVFNFDAFSLDLHVSDGGISCSYGIDKPVLRIQEARDGAELSGGNIDAVVALGCHIESSDTSYSYDLLEVPFVGDCV